MSTMHEEIAKARFLTMRQQGYSTNAAAKEAIEEATFFTLQYRAWRDETTKKESRACPACFGLIGKKAEQCRFCNGTGRVLSHAPTGQPG